MYAASPFAPTPPQDLRDDNSFEMMVSGLPSSQILVQLIEAFFNTINVWIPTLCYSSVKVLVEDYRELSEEDEVLLHAITTATLRFLPEGTLSDGERMGQRSHSMSRVKLYVLEHVSMRTLQSLVILCIDAFGVDRMPALLDLLRRQFNILSAQNSSSASQAANDYPTPRSYGSSPISIFEEKTKDPTPIDADCLQWTEQAIRLLEQSCQATIASRSNSLFDHPGNETRATKNCKVDLSSITSAVSNKVLGYEEAAVLAEQSDVLTFMARVLTFGQVSLSRRGMASQREWRKEYANLHRKLQQGATLAKRKTSNTFVGSGADTRDIITLLAIHLGGSVYLHSIAAHMLSDLNWDPHLAREEWRKSLTSLVDLVAGLPASSLSPTIAMCINIACRSSLCFDCFLNHGMASVKTLLQTLQDMGKFWSLVKSYADHLRHTLSAMQNSTSAVHSDVEQHYTAVHSGMMQDAIPPRMSGADALATEEVSFLADFDWTMFGACNDADLGTPISLDGSGLSPNFFAG